MGIGFLFDISVIICIATVFAYLSRLLRQPLIPAYILAGILIGPFSPLAKYYGFPIIESMDEVLIMAELGIAFLLFGAGIELNIKKLRKVGLHSILGASVQMIGTFSALFIFSSYIGFGGLESALIAASLSFSSTMIVMKILADKGVMNALYSRIMVGVLLFQDFIAVLVILFFQNPAAIMSAEAVSFILIKGAGLFAIAILLSKFALPRLLEYAAKSRELLFMTAVSACFAFMGFAHLLGFSIAIGGFIGGLALASFPFNIEVSNNIRPLRDFFSTIFFTSLGMQLDITALWSSLPVILSMLFILLAVKTALLSSSFTMQGYGLRIPMMVGLGLSQSSEFSLILAKEGMALGSISPEIYNIIIIVTLVSMTATPYIMSLGGSAAGRLASLIPRNPIFRRNIDKLNAVERKILKDHIVLFGCNRMGGIILEKVDDMNVLVVDHDPDIIKEINEVGKANVKSVYGEADNPQILRKLNLKEARLAVITIPDEELCAWLAMKIKERNPNLMVFVRARSTAGAMKLYDIADLVIIPEFIAGDSIVREIKTHTLSDTRRKLRKRKIVTLRRMKEEIESYKMLR